MSDIEWLYNLKKKAPDFLKKIKGTKRKGFYHYSYTGDYYSERIKWGLGNAVFFLKIIYTLKIEDLFKNEIETAGEFIKSFQNKNGEFSDKLLSALSLPKSYSAALKKMNLDYLSKKYVNQAETRQAISSLSLFGIKPNYDYLNFPQSENNIKQFLENLDWKLPWSAGSHFSHLLFFLSYSSLSNKETLINCVIDWVKTIQKDDGFWYQGAASTQQKINGAMKIISGLKVADKVTFDLPEKIIDTSLEAKNDKHACDNFNVAYILKYCSQLLGHSYRIDEIKNFMYNRLQLYKKYYFHEIGGFSFFENMAGNYYYNAKITKGKNEPDIHGTVMFLWGISVIAQVIGIEKELDFREFVT
ncbi:MAG: hypothetical protein V1853_02660 [bacterium]